MGAGKAAATMAAAFEASYPWACEGLVVTRHGYATPTRSIRVLEAGHPVPDEAGLAAAQTLLRLAASARPGDRVVFLLSGGASALLPAPVEGLTLQDEAAAARVLLASGAPIAEVNRIRSALSIIKAGGLSRACPEPITTLAISDVVGDDLAAIGSGPTWSAVADGPPALEIVDALRAHLPPHVRALLARPRVRSPEPAGIGRSVYHLVARGADMIGAAAEAARLRGVGAAILQADATGEATNVAAAHALSAQATGVGPTVLISGGELTVTLSADAGRGGPNQEYALALAAALQGPTMFWSLALDSDGIDGVGDAAGARTGPDTAIRAASRGWDIEATLRRHDSGSLLNDLDDLVMLGPTGTNVNDLRLIYRE